MNTSCFLNFFFAFLMDFFGVIPIFVPIGSPGHHILYDTILLPAFATKFGHDVSICFYSLRLYIALKINHG